MAALRSDFRIHRLRIIRRSRAAEAAAQELKRQVRTLILISEERFTCEFADVHPLVFGCLVHAVCLMSRFRI